MRVRSTFWCVYVPGILLFSNASFGELRGDGGIDSPSFYGVSGGSYSAFESAAHANANSNCPYSTAVTGGWNDVYTTTDGFFDWMYTMWTRGEFVLTFGPPSSTIFGAGGGKVESSAPDGGNAVAANASHSDTASSGIVGWGHDPGTRSVSGFDYFWACDGLYVKHRSFAGASVTLPTGGDGYGGGSAYAICAMY